MPKVSVVIPTHKRPELVLQAVSSALAQTLRDIEVIVVIDGADDETCQALESIHDHRLMTVPVHPVRGNAGARNVGISHARAEWVALLDDDDLWKPEKLERQLDFAEATAIPRPIVSCRFEAVGNGARFVWPARFPRRGEPISEYLFTRKGPAVSGAIQTSTLLVPRAVFDEVSFDEKLDRYVDLDWLLRAAALQGVELAFVPGETLSTYSMNDSRKRISNQSGWQRDVEWLRERRSLVTSRAYGGYLLTQASIRAEKSREKAAFLPLIREAVKGGRISLGELTFHIGNTFLPGRIRRALTHTSDRRSPFRRFAWRAGAIRDAGRIDAGAQGRPMRILIYSAAEKGDAAGVQGVVIGLAEHLREVGHNVVTAWPDGDGTRRDWRLHLEAGVGSNGRPTPSGMLRAGFDMAVLARRIAQFRPDVVNLHYPRGQTLYFEKLRHVFGYRIVLSFHNSDLHEASSSVRARLPGWLRGADGVTVVSKELAGGLAAIAPDVPVEIIQNGVNTRFWTPGRHDRNDPHLIAAAGRLLPLKGFDILLRAMAMPAAAEARLIIAGQGNERANLEQQIRDLGLEDRVQLAGRFDRSQLLGLFRKAGLFVLPSRREGMPLVLFEAMATGLPVVATTVGGVPQVMADGVGELIQAEDPDALARAIGSRIGRPEVLAQEGERALERARLFASAASYERYLDIFRQDNAILKRPGSSAAAARLRNNSLPETSAS